MLDTAPDDDVMDAAGDLRGGEVDGLLGGPALEIDGRRGCLDRETLLQPGVATDVETLGTELRDAAGDHILDLAGVDARALDDREVGGAEELIGMGVLVVALLGVTAPDGRPGGFNDDDLAAVAIAIRRHLRLLLSVCQITCGRAPKIIRMNGPVLYSPVTERLGIAGAGTIACGLAATASVGFDVLLWARSERVR